MATEQPEITVSLQDMETYLEPEEYQAFLRAKKEVDEYREKKAEYDKKKAEYDKKKAEAEQSRDECQKKRDEAKSDDERRFWDAERSKYVSKALVSSPPDYSVHCIGEHDRLLGLVRERKVEEERRKEALKSMDLPVDDAKKYLSDSEYEMFLDSLLGAADAYIGGGKGCFLNDWRLDRRAGDYMGLTSIIKERKEREACRKQAQLEYEQFIREIKDGIKKMKQELAKERKPKFSYPKWLVDYHPNLWCELALPTKQQIKDWARPQIQERVPLALREFVEWDLSLQVQTLPDGKYEVVGIPCLTWCFTVLGLVKVHLRLVEKEIVKEFHGYRYPMKTDAEELGHFYLGPALGGHQEGFTTPIALLTLLAKGELEGLGIKAIEHSFPLTTFTIQGFDEEVQVHKDFRKFIIDMGKDGALSDALLAKHVIDQTSATLMKEKAKLPLPQPVGGEVTVGESASDNSDVVAALEVMGFKKMEIKAGIEAAHLSPGMSLEEKIKAVLKSIDS